jgi:hypothetical protein
MTLSNNIWTTRKSRINTSERLSQNDFISKILITYYSTFLIVFSIMDIEVKNFDIEKFTLILSILILVLSIFVLSMNFKERSLILKTSYIKMSKLYRDISNKEKNNENYEDLENQYNTIVELTENHSTYDYLKLLNSLKNDEGYKNLNPVWTWSKAFQLLGYRIIKILMMIFLFIIPIVIYIIIN